MSNTFYRKYRPQTFADVVGQKHVVTTLTNALKFGRVGQAYLFTGPRGTGKTTLARLFAKAINCQNRGKNKSEPCGKCEHCLLMAEGRSLDIIEIDAASHTGVDNIRELRETVKLPPTLGSHKIYIIDEVHMLSIGAFNALLKTLEEPPSHVVFILATTALHKVPDTIISRCQRFDLSRFPLQSIVLKLTKIAKEENLKVEPAALEMIAQTAEGGMRDAESLFMQIASLEDSTITEESVIEILGTTKKANLTHLLELLQKNNLYESLAFIRKISQEGNDLSIFAGSLLHYLRDVLLVCANGKESLSEFDSYTEEEKENLLRLSTFTPEQVVDMLEHFQIAQVATKTAVIPELPLEIAIVKILSGNPSHSNTPGGNPPASGPSELPSTEREHSKKDETKTATEIKRESEREDEKKTLIEEVNSLELSAVSERWSLILDTAKRLNASLTLGLSTAKPIEVRGSTLVIAVKYPFHKERLDEKANRLTLASAFDTILGQKMKLSIVLDESPKPKNASDEPSKELSPSPLINDALSMLGGRIVEGA